MDSEPHPGRGFVWGAKGCLEHGWAQHLQHPVQPRQLTIDVLNRKLHSVRGRKI